MLKSGVVIDLLMLLLLFAAVLYYLWRVSRGLSVPPIRRIEGMEAIEEGIGRAVEMGRPVHYCTGDFGRLSGPQGPAVIASLNLYSYTVQICAKNDIKIYTSLGMHPEIIPLAEAITEEAYKAAGKPELYDPANILYYGDWSGGLRLAKIGTILEHNVGLNIEAGVLWTNIASHAMARTIGALNIGGTIRWVGMYGQAIVCDYLLITEEILAAGAKASEDPTLTSSIAAEDIGKFVVLGIGIISLILGLIHSGALTNILVL